ncbi:MAG TPA: LapA family protein [Casimicrobiaceae bacterium]
MPLKSILLLLVLGALALFVIVNWTAFTTPTTLSLLVGSVEAPLGLIMLLIAGVLAAIFLGYAFYLQTTALLETRRMTRELAAQRQLADQAEASRFTELRTTLGERLDRLEQGLRTALDHAGNGLAAQIAELEDRIARR